MSMKYTLRFAKPDDAEKLLEIYAPFVISSERTLSDVSFEYEVPSVEEFTERIKNISAHYPYIVCEMMTDCWVMFMPILICSVLPISGVLR